MKVLPIPEDWVPIQCKYCIDGETMYNSRKPSKNDYEVLTGFEIFIRKNIMYVYNCMDKQYIKPLSDLAEVKINYCPMCGRKLKGD